MRTAATIILPIWLAACDGGGIPDEPRVEGQARDLAGYLYSLR